MGPPAALRDIVGKTKNVLLVGVIPLHAQLDIDLVALGDNVDGFGVQWVLVAAQVGDKGLDTALVFEHIFLAVALVNQSDPHAGVEERKLAQALGQNVVTECDVREDLRARFKAHIGAGFPTLPDLGQRLLRLPQEILLIVNLAAPPDREFQALGQGVDHGNADPVQPPRNLVGILVELSARVQDGHDHLGRGALFLRDDFGGDSASVVRDGDRAVAVDHHTDLIAVTCQRLVYGVVHGLEHHVVQAGTIVRIADVHPGALSDGIEPLQNLDAVGVVCGFSFWNTHGWQWLFYHPRVSDGAKLCVTAFRYGCVPRGTPVLEAHRHDDVLWVLAFGGIQHGTVVGVDEREHNVLGFEGGNGVYQIANIEADLNRLAAVVRGNLFLGLFLLWIMRGNPYRFVSDTQPYTTILLA